MGMNKRDFLKLTGIAAATAATGPALEAGASQGHGEKKDKSGVRWAMVIDLREDIDWASCVEACNVQHNVPNFVDNEADPSVNDKKHEIKWIWTTPYEAAFEINDPDIDYLSKRLQELQMPVLCNHCDNPPCVRACPTQATFKRKDGIVVMDFHRCIGCRFCMGACPYGSRSFNFLDPRLGLKDKDAPGGWAVTNPDFPTRMKGVVEKCNFCAELLAVGKKPACLDACKEGAIAFGNLNDPNEAKEPADPNGPIRDQGVAWILAHHHTVKRKPEVGTMPMVYYIL